MHKFTKDVTHIISDKSVADMLKIFKLDKFPDAIFVTTENWVPECIRVTKRTFKNHS